MKNFRHALVLLFIGAILNSCSSNPYFRTNRVHKKQLKAYSKKLREFPPEQEKALGILVLGKHQAGTTNFNLRKPNYVVIHHTAQTSVEQTLKTFTLPRTQLSSHYVISRNGEVYQMLNDYYRALHGGAGKWGNTKDLNSSSIGIELDNNGFEPFPPALIKSLLALLESLKERHSIPAANFIGHSDIAPSRKVDPNPNFPWALLAKEGYGLWYDDIIVSKNFNDDAGNQIQLEMSIQESNIKLETSADTITTEYDGVDPQLALRIIGYDTSNMDAAIKAFKLHFIQGEINGILTDQDLKILNNLYKKYM